MYSILDKYVESLRPCDDAPFCGSDGRYHFTYVIINKTNEKFYIGKHSTIKLDDNYLGSGYGLLAAIKKYGPENFTIFYVSFHSTANEAYAKEETLISEKMIKSDDCYNRKSGGNGFASGDKNPVFTQMNEGKNIFIGERNPQRLARLNGTHRHKNVEPWNNPSIDPNKNGFPAYTWAKSDIFYEIYQITKSTKKQCLLGKLAWDKGIDKDRVSRCSIENMLKKFRNNWNPYNDESWLDFQLTYSVPEPT